MRNLTSVAAFCLVLSAWAHPVGAEPIFVVTTTEDLAAIVRSVGGEDVRVQSITRGDQDPHHVDAKPSHMTVLRHAELLVYVGLDLEVGWLPLLIDGARNPRVRPGRPGHLDASTVVEVLDRPVGAVDRSHGDVHPAGNPHYWLNPHNVLAVAAQVEERLAALRPAVADTVRRRGKAYRSGLQAATARWRAQAAPLRGARFVVYHATFRYLVDWLGLEIVGRVEERPGIPPSPRHLARLTASMRDRPARAILSTPYDPRATVRRLGAKTGARALFLPSSVGSMPGVDTYEALMDRILADLLGDAP